MYKLKGRPSAAQAVGEIDELLLQILPHLPHKSLCKFKTVSKRWLSFADIIYRTRIPTPVRGLLLQYSTIDDFYNPDLHLVPLLNTAEEGDCTHSHGLLGFENQETAFAVLQSVNGLLLCARMLNSPRKRLWQRLITDYYVYNPLTGQHATLPSLPRHFHVTASLVYEPSTSPHYKVVALCHSRIRKIMIYSSETRSWRCWDSSSFEPGLREVGKCISIDPNNNGVFWNGSIYYISCWKKTASINRLHRFDMENEMMVRANLPGGGNYVMIYLLTASWGRLYLMVAERETIYGRYRFKVYEMEDNEWVVKYNLDTCFDWDIKPKQLFRGLAIRLPGDQNQTYTSHCRLFFPPPDENGEHELWLSFMTEKVVLRCNLQSRSVIVASAWDGVDDRVKQFMMAHEIMHSTLDLP